MPSPERDERERGVRLDAFGERGSTMNKSTAAYVTATFLAALLLCDEARADAAGDRLLSEMDAALNRAATLTMEYELVNQEPGKQQGKLRMSALIKGDKR